MSEKTRQDTIREEYAAMAKGYDAGSADCGWSAPTTLANTMKDMSLIKPGMRIVDFAAGTGDLSKAFREGVDGKTLHITATDLSPEMLDMARKKGVADELAQQDITKAWSMPKETVDIAAATGVWEYLTDAELEPVIQNAANALKKGGILAFSFLPASERGNESVQQGHSEERIRGILAQNGIGLEKEEKFPAYRTDSGTIMHHVLAIGKKL